MDAPLAVRDGYGQDARHGMAKTRGNHLVLALAAVLLSTPAPAQQTGSITALLARDSADWSGPPGASGHPEMSAEAIRAATADFPNCIARLWPEAARRHISRANFDRYTRGLTPDLKIMDLLDSQPEFTKAVWDYLDILVTDARIEKGRAMLDKHRAIFDAVEKAYGVDRHVIAAIWGVETNYGAIAGNRPVLRSTATPALVVIEILLGSDLETVEVAFPVLDLAEASPDYEAGQVTLDLVVDFLANEPYPAASFDPSVCPGLFG